jgi:tRNA A-37 threonylcarbamoyl transferase component Bud32
MKSVKETSVIIKKYTERLRERFQNELIIYQSFPEYAPDLIAFDEERLILIIEKCTPILDIPDNEKYRDELWNLLEALHNEGVNHRDVSLVNVVVHDTRGVLLIDFEHATFDIGTKSIDLYGCIEAGVPNTIGDVYGENGIWWGGNHHNLTPGQYWDKNNK